MPLEANNDGGLRSQDLILLDLKLSIQKEVCPTSIRFLKSDSGLLLVAVDTNGQVIEKCLRIYSS